MVNCYVIYLGKIKKIVVDSDGSPDTNTKYTRHSEPIATYLT